MTAAETTAHCGSDRQNTVPRYSTAYHSQSLTVYHPSHSFANQPANSLFRIDPLTGEVKTTGSLGTESGRLFHLEVRTAAHNSERSLHADRLIILTRNERALFTELVDYCIWQPGRLLTARAYFYMH